MIKKGEIKGEFSQISNAIWTAKISANAKVLFAYLNSKPESWKISWKLVAGDLSLSRQCVYKVRDELVAANLITLQMLEGGDFCVLINMPKVKNNNTEKKLKKITFDEKNDTINKENMLDLSNEQYGNEFFSNEKNSKKTSKKNFCENKNSQNLSSFLNAAEIHTSQNKSDSQKIAAKNLVSGGEAKKADKAQKAAALAKKCFDSVDLSAFAESERELILAFFEFRAKNTRKSDFDEQVAAFLIKQLQGYKGEGKDVSAIISRAIANAWVGLQWAANELYKQNFAKNYTPQNNTQKPFIPRFFNANDECKFIMGEMEKLCLCDKGDISKFWLMNYDELAAKYPQVLGCKVGLVGGYLAFLRDSKVG